MIKKSTGFTVLETMFVSTFMLALSMILYMTLNAASKTNNNLFNNEVLVRQTATSFAERLSRRLNQSYAGLINIYRENTTGLRDTSSALMESSIVAIGFPYQSEESPNRSFTIDFENANPPERLYYEDNTPRISSESEFITILSGAMRMDKFILYYYDRDGSSFGERNAVYELYAFFDMDKEKFCLKKIRDIAPDKHLDALKNFVTMAKNKGAYRKVASRVVFFDVLMEQYPVIDVRSAFAYGKGEIGTRTVLTPSDSAEVFVLNFTASPGL